MLCGAALHALWNGSALFADFFHLYVTLQVPLFVAFVLGIVALRREEARLTRARLSEYAAAGWFTPAEVDLLATPAGGAAPARGPVPCRATDRRRWWRSFEMPHRSPPRASAPARDETRDRPRTSVYFSLVRPRHARRCSRADPRRMP
jgi:hypothetical protein